MINSVMMVEFVYLDIVERKCDYEQVGGLSSKAEPHLRACPLGLPSSH